MKKVYLTLDTECIGIDDRRVYDLAYAIHYKDGTIIATFNALVEEVIYNGDLMGGAFYNKKVYSHYLPRIAAQEIQIMPWQDIIDQFRHDLAAYEVDTICAYNIGFDIRAMCDTAAYYGDDDMVTGGDYNALCIWQFVCEAILSRPKYRQTCEELGWFKTSTGNVYTNAEKAFAYITGEWGFVENHTAMEDVFIEVEILAACFKQKRKIPLNYIDGSPWKLAQ